MKILDTNTDLNRNIALLTIRLLLAFIFLMQGYGKVFNWGVDNIFTNFFMPYNEYLPVGMLKIAAYFTSYVELIGGVWLLFGWRRDLALYLLAIVLIIVTFGHGLSEPIWDLQHVMYRAILLIALLLLPKEWDRFSLDGIVANFPKRNG